MVTIIFSLVSLFHTRFSIESTDSGLEGGVYFKKAGEWRYFNLKLEDISQFAELRNPPTGIVIKLIPVLNCKLGTGYKKIWSQLVLRDQVHFSKKNRFHKVAKKKITDCTNSFLGIGHIQTSVLKQC